MGETENVIQRLIQELIMNDNKEAREFLEEWFAGKEQPRKPREAMNKLVQLGKPALKPLLELLENTTKFSCIYAIEVLGEMKDPNAARPLINLWDNEKFIGVFDDYIDFTGSYIDGSTQIRIALQKIGLPALPFILSYLDEQKKKGNKNGVIEALITLSKIEDEQSYAALTDALFYPDDEVQYWAVDSLVAYGDKRAIKHIVELLEHPDWKDDKDLLKQHIRDLAEQG